MCVEGWGQARLFFLYERCMVIITFYRGRSGVVMIYTAFFERGLLFFSAAVKIRKLASSLVTKPTKPPVPGICLEVRNMHLRGLSLIHI